MALTSVIEKLGKAIFETPFGANRLSRDAPEFAEVRLAILEAVKAKSYRASGKFVFPYTLVRIQLRGIPEDQASVFEGDFLRDYFASELKTSLERSSYRFPSDLRVEIQTTPDLPRQGEDWLTVEPAMKVAADSAAPVQHNIGKIIVEQGVANHTEVTLDKPRINIGRTVEVFRGAGPSRRNDLAFTEENPTNISVSREHAHILHSGSNGEYRIFNDRSYKGDANCGIWIVRDGLSQPVHRSARGALLKNGDQIHLGTAVLRFEQEEP